MKYLIIYMSHHGTTRKIVQQLAENLGEACTTVINLEKENVPDLSPYDTILIGGSIHLGEIQKKIKKFCKEHEPVLLQKRVGLFLSSIETEEISDEFTNAFPENLRNHALAHGFFGGELLLDKMNIFEKYFVKAVYGIRGNLSSLDQKAIDSFEQKITH